MILGLKRYTSPSYLVGKGLAYATKYAISKVKNKKGEMKNVQQQRKQ